MGGNALRAAVLGVNDGLVSNFSLVMGVAGADPGGAAALVAGLAGLVAGSLSMALGEWLSVQSARELYANQIAIEAGELASFPDEEEEELRLIYEAKGIDPGEARSLARRIVSGDPRVAVETMAREELGIDPDELGGSAWVAATTSLLLFAAGAIVPVLPFLVLSGPAAIMGAAALFLPPGTGPHRSWGDEVRPRRLETGRAYPEPSRADDRRRRRQRRMVSARLISILAGRVCAQIEPISDLCAVDEHPLSAPLRGLVMPLVAR